jgi:cell division protein FtsL
MSTYNHAHADQEKHQELEAIEAQVARQEKMMRIGFVALMILAVLVLIFIGLNIAAL